jgi:hypothetical protein
MILDFGIKRAIENGEFVLKITEDLGEVTDCRDTGMPTPAEIIDRGTTLDISDNIRSKTISNVDK